MSIQLTPVPAWSSPAWLPTPPTAGFCQCTVGFPYISYVKKTPNRPRQPPAVSKCTKWTKIEWKYPTILPIITKSTFDHTEMCMFLFSGVPVSWIIPSSPKRTTRHCDKVWHVDSTADIPWVVIQLLSINTSLSLTLSSRVPDNQKVKSKVK